MRPAGMQSEDFANDLLQRASDATRRTELAIESIRTDVRWIREQGERHENAIFGSNGDNGLRSRVKVLEQRYPAAVNMVEAAIRQMPGEPKDEEAKWVAVGKWGIAFAALSSFGMQIIQLIRGAS